MKIINKPTKPKEFKSYETARIAQDSSKSPEPATKKEVKAATNKINPDEESMESRG